MKLYAFVCPPENILLVSVICVQLLENHKFKIQDRLGTDKLGNFTQVLQKENM